MGINFCRSNGTQLYNIVVFNEYNEFNKKKLNKRRNYGSLNQQTDQRIDKMTDILAMLLVKQDNFMHVFE